MYCSMFVKFLIHLSAYSRLSATGFHIIPPSLMHSRICVLDFFIYLFQICNMQSTSHLVVSMSSHLSKSLQVMQMKTIWKGVQFPVV